MITAPEVNEQVDFIFQPTVTNDENTTSEYDEVTITVNPPPVKEKPNPMSDLIKDIVPNPLNVTISINSVY